VGLVSRLVEGEGGVSALRLKNRFVKSTPAGNHFRPHLQPANHGGQTSICKHDLA
jgi:hypothetical protein